MKMFVAVLALFTAFTTHALELQIQECKFGKSMIEFMPSPTLSAVLKKEVNGALVYKVKYKRGTMLTGPKDDMAIVEEISNNKLQINFFQQDEEGIFYLPTTINVDLLSPTSADEPVIIFNSKLWNGLPVKGKCTLNF